MLYVFACLSPSCISDQRALRLYRGYALDSEEAFASGKEWDKVYGAKNDEELKKMGFEVGEEEIEGDEDEDEEGFVDMKKVGIKLDEWMIETD